MPSTASENLRNTKSQKSESASELVKCAATKYGENLSLLQTQQIPQNGTMTTSGLLKCGNLVKCRKQARKRPVPNKLVIDIDMDSDTAAESDLPLSSRSFLNRVNDRLRKMLNRSPDDSMQDIDKRSMIWRKFMSSTLEASVFMGKNYSEILLSIKNTGENLTLKKMFDTSEKLILDESDEILGVSQISWESSPWKQVSLINYEEVISLSHAKVYVFSDSVVCLRKMNQNPISHTVWERQLEWFKDSSQKRTLDTIDGDPMEFEWNIFPGFTTLQLINKVQKFMSNMGEPERFQGRIIFMTMFNDILWRNEDNEKECTANFTLVCLFEKKISSRTLVIPRTWV